MKAFIFLPFMLLATFSVSSTQTWKTSGSKPGENSEPALVLMKKNDLDNQEGQKESNKQGGGNTQGNRGILVLQGQPGYSNQPGKPGNSNQVKPEANQPGNSGGNGKPGTDSQKGKPGSSGQQGKPGSSGQQGKPGSSSQQGKPGSSSQQGKPRSSNNQEGRKNTNNPLNGNTAEEIKIDSSNGKNPTGNTKCQSIYKPVCGSDGKTYGNRCVFNEAKRGSHGKLSLSHEGKC